ncbi:unnamed protein product [Sympodiomycopsis kandeliae]
MSSSSSSPASSSMMGQNSHGTENGESSGGTISRSSSATNGTSSASPLRRQPSALAFWQSQTGDSSRCSTSSPSPRPRRRTDFSTDQREASVTDTPTKMTHPASSDRPMDDLVKASWSSSPVTNADGSAKDTAAARSKRRKKKLVEMKRRHDLKKASKATASPVSSTTVRGGSPSHLDLSENWSSNSEEDSADEPISNDDDEREVSYSGIDLDERLGIGSSSSRRSSTQTHKVTRSLQSSPPSVQKSSVAMTASASHDTGMTSRHRINSSARRNSRESESAESDSFYDVNEDADAAPSLRSTSPQSSGLQDPARVVQSSMSFSSSSDSVNSSADDEEDDLDATKSSSTSRSTDDAGLHSWLNIRSGPSVMSSSATLRQEHMQVSPKPKDHSKTASSSIAPSKAIEDYVEDKDNPQSADSSLPSTSSSSILPISPPSPSNGGFSASFLPSPPLAQSKTFSSANQTRLPTIPPPRPLPSGPLPPTPDTRPSPKESLAAAGAITRPTTEAATHSTISEGTPPEPLTALPQRTAGATLRPDSVSDPSRGLAISDMKLGPSGTVRGRPRGATIGAVPSGLAANRSSSFLGGRMGGHQNPRPRSLLSHELVMANADAQSPVPSLSTRAASSAATPSSQTDSRRTSVDTGAEPHTSSTTLSALEGHFGNSKLNASGSSVAGSYGATDAGSATSSLSPSSIASASVANSSSTGRSRSGSTASLLQQVQQPLRSHASFVIAVVGHKGAGKSTVIKKGLRQFGLSKPQVLSEKVISHSTGCVVDSEQTTIEVLEIDTSVLLNGSTKRFTWPKFLPRIDAVILCYDASQVETFRGMSELLENFSVKATSTVMLACKSEIHPKNVDPFYASDMAGIYNVGLAECSVQSDEGKKRMRDCFSYLVKEVAKKRALQRRKGSVATSAAPSTVSTSSAPAVTSASDWRNITSATASAPLTRTPSYSSHKEDSDSLDRRNRAGSDGSTASSMAWEQTSGSGGAGMGGRSQRAPSDSASSHHHHHHHHHNHQRFHHDQHQPHSQPRPQYHAPTSNSASMPSGPSSGFRSTSHDAASEGLSFVGDDSEGDVAAVQESITKAKLGLQSAKSVGGYVTIEELWDKLFFSAVSGNDTAFVHMFMVFYRGFVRPIELLKQLIGRFNKLADGETVDGVMIRYSLIRLVTMLSEWMQDYPGDLSGTETYPILCDFVDRLCSHSSTMHVAAQVVPLLEKVHSAPDLDAAWSKDQDSSRPKSVAADVPPVRPPLTPDASQANTPDLQNQRPQSRGRSHSDASSFGQHSERSVLSESASMSASPASTRKLAAEPDIPEPRTRSGSDVTTSSGEIGSRARHAFSSGRSTTANNVSEGSNASSAGGPVSMDAHQQKLALRAVSNQLSDLEDVAIAGELTHLEWKLFLTIRPRDLLRHILVPRDVRGKEGPVARCIAYFNYISFWVCSMILVQSKAKHRARMLEKFMNIAAILRHDNNYNTLQAVLAGLGNAAVHRLKQTRELLAGKPVNKTYQSLARLMGSDRSFAAYRLALENSDGRTIPYLGVHLQDILSISDGNPSKRGSDDMIHWRKFSLMDEAVRAIVRCQDWNMKTKGQDSIGRLIMDLPVMDEDVLYNRSLQVEPRASQSNSSSAGSKILNILKPAAHN